MKLLVSDYDQTMRIYSLSGDIYTLKKTIKKIKKFMEDGNKFMIATARPYSSIINEVNKYNIPYDFISTLNGCIIHNNKGNIIYSKNIKKLNEEELYKLYSCIKKIEKIKDKDKLLYYIFKIKLLENEKQLFNHLKKSKYDIQSWFFNTYNIIHPVSNKIDSVKYIENLLNIDKENIITIGDANDDLEMIKYYYSYGIIKIPPNLEILKNCNKKVKSLNAAFKHINKNI